MTCFKIDKNDCSIISCHDGELFVLDFFNRQNKPIDNTAFQSYDYQKGKARDIYE